MQAKISTDTWFPVVLLDATDGDTEETGVAYSDLTVKYVKMDGTDTLATYSVASGNWDEKGEGIYSLQIGASEFDSEGIWEVSVSAAVAKKYRFYVDVVDKTHAELVDDVATVDGNVDAILVDTGTTLPSTLSTIAEYIDTEVAAIKAVTDNLPNGGALTDLATAAALATVDSLVDQLIADIVTASCIDTGFTLKTAVKRMLAVLDGTVTLDGTKKIHTIKNKAASTETTHTLSDSGRTIS